MHFEFKPPLPPTLAYACLRLADGLVVTLGGRRAKSLVDLTMIGSFVCESQEIPASFTTETGWPSVVNCALVTSISLQKEWPLRLRRFPDMRRGVSAVSIGEGWARFMSDQGLGLGALLTFEIVDERCLVVGIHRRSALKVPQTFQQLPDASQITCDSREQPEVFDLFADHSPRPSAHEIPRDARPHFLKILRKTHIQKCASSRIVSWVSSRF